MRSQLFRWTLMLGLAATTLVGTVELASAQPHVRDHRRPSPGDRVNDRGPRSAPPAARVERKPKRRGFVWVAGHWDWNNGRWQWVSGRYEKRRSGQRWREAKWEQRGDVWVRVDGTWEQYDDRPRVAPPPPRAERWRPRRGFVWVAGHYEWDDGEWQWVKGRYEREQVGKRWREARWEQRDGVWIKVGGIWEVASPYPTAPPPARRVENQKPRRGFVWVSGHWDWKNGNWDWVAGRWERERPNQRWNETRWEQRDGRWQRIDGGWGSISVSPAGVNASGGVTVSTTRPTTTGPVGPTSPPPALRPEAGGTRAGYLFVRGHYEWRNNQYQWVPGHWERQRARMRWVDSRWERRGSSWVFVKGGWQ